MNEQEKMDQFASDLLGKTREKKLVWQAKKDLSPEVVGQFFVDLDAEIAFHIRKFKSKGHAQLSLALVRKSATGMIFSDVDNIPSASGIISNEQANRFRLYSDLYDAASESTLKIEETLHQAEELLRNIG